jgi:hypothetical protein
MGFGGFGGCGGKGFGGSGIIIIIILLLLFSFNDNDFSSLLIYVPGIAQTLILICNLPPFPSRSLYAPAIFQPGNSRL